MAAGLAYKISSNRIRKLLFLFLIVLGIGCQENVNPTPPAEIPAPFESATTPSSLESVELGQLADFMKLLDQAESSKANERQPMVDRYVALLDSAPITNKDSVVFIWRGDATTVHLVGDMNNWIIDDAPQLERLVGTDLWYLELSFEEDARLDYKYVIDDVDWRLDPLNPRTIAGGFGPNSELVMPEYQGPSELLPTNDSIAAGTLESHTLDSTFLGQTRTFFVYEPAGQIVGAKTPSIYINDGGDYLNLIETTAILDRLIAERKTPPLVAVFVPPINRELEYTFNNDYVSFLADELVPFIQRTYDTDPDPAKTGTLGASLGGLAAFNTMISRPDVFGLVAAQSGVYSLDDDRVIDKLKAANKAYQKGGRLRRDLRMYFVVGTYETAISGSTTGGNLLAVNRRLLDVLESTDYDYLYEERPEGHSWGLWEGTLGQALSYLFNQSD